jgi:PQQ-dependent catabolism-associated beta-propeller protein
VQVLTWIGSAACALLVFASRPAPAETIYVSNELDNTISVVDGSSLEVTETIPVGRRPRGLALSADRKSLFVASGDDNRVDVIDLAARKEVRSLQSGPDPELFVVAPDGKRLFIANENDNLVSVMDVASGKITGEVPVGVEPEGMAIDATGAEVLCTSETTSMVHMIDAHSLGLIDNLLVDTRPRFAAYSPDGKQIWVSSEIRGTVTVFDRATHRQIHKIAFSVPGVDAELVQAVGFVLTGDGAHAYVALGPANRVAEVDAHSFVIERLYLVGQRVWHVALSADEKRLYTANGNSSDISVIDIKNHEVLKSLGVGRGPWGVVVGP